MKYWFVNLGKYYDEQRNGNFIWAPIKNQKGKTLQHWENLTLVNEGDVIFCNRKGKIKAIAIANCRAYKSSIPDVFNQSWKPEGRRIDLTIYDLEKPFHFSSYKGEYLKNIDFKKNPFNTNGGSKQGYLYPIENQIAELFLKYINDKNINKILEMNSEDKNNEFEEIKEENEQFEKINNGSVTGYTKDELKEIESKKYKYTPRIDNSKNKFLREKTDPKLKATRIELSNYNCEINHNHKTFTNAAGTHQYLECHHIIPISAQKDFPNVKLDSLFNLISLCPICHAEVHYANLKEKGEIFSKMYELRKNEMLEHGFDLKEINEIFNKYYK